LQRNKVEKILKVLGKKKRTNQTEVRF